MPLQSSAAQSKRKRDDLDDDYATASYDNATKRTRGSPVAGNATGYVSINNGQDHRHQVLPNILAPGILHENAPTYIGPTGHPPPLPVQSLPQRQEPREVSAYYRPDDEYRPQPRTPVQQRYSPGYATSGYYQLPQTQPVYIPALMQPQYPQGATGTPEYRHQQRINQPVYAPEWPTLPVYVPEQPTQPIYAPAPTLPVYHQPPTAPTTQRQQQHHTQGYTQREPGQSSYPQNQHPRVTQSVEAHDRIFHGQSYDLQQAPYVSQDQHAQALQYARSQDSSEVLLQQPRIQSQQPQHRGPPALHHGQQIGMEFIPRPEYRPQGQLDARTGMNEIQPMIHTPQMDHPRPVHGLPPAVYGRQVDLSELFDPPKLPVSDGHKFSLGQASNPIRRSVAHDLDISTRAIHAPKEAFDGGISVSRKRRVSPNEGDLGHLDHKSKRPRVFAPLKAPGAPRDEQTDRAAAGYAPVSLPQTASSAPAENPNSSGALTNDQFTMTHPERLMHMFTSEQLRAKFSPAALNRMFDWLQMAELGMLDIMDLTIENESYFESPTEPEPETVPTISEEEADKILADLLGRPFVFQPDAGPQSLQETAGEAIVGDTRTTKQDFDGSDDASEKTHGKEAAGQEYTDQPRAPHKGQDEAPKELQDDDGLDDLIGDSEGYTLTDWPSSDCWEQPDGGDSFYSELF